MKLSRSLWVIEIDDGKGWRSTVWTDHERAPLRDEMIVYRRVDEESGCESGRAPWKYSVVRYVPAKGAK